MTSKVELKDVSKAYAHDKPVIEGLNFQIREGSFTVLLGPSGCGKSTILRLIAGLEQENAGSISIDGIHMKNVEPGDRNIAMVFQNYALYPTMTVKENIEFGLKNMKVPKEERRERINEIAELVGLSEYMDRKPQTLSGGQRQRVALARAIVKKPAVFLMDEPLSNLDAKLRNQIRTELIELHNKLKTTFVYVTHDQTEAMSLGTDIVLLQKGKIMQQGSPHDIYHHPANIFTAQFIGSPPMNVISCDMLNAYSSLLPKDSHYTAFRPEHAQLGSVGKVTDKDVLVIDGELVTHEMLGSETLYKINTPVGQVHVKLYDTKLLDYGPVQTYVNRDRLYFFDRNERLMPNTGTGGLKTE